MKPVDSHAHLDFERYDNDREKVIQRAGEKLEFVVNAGCNLERNCKSLELEKKYPDTVVANLGLHPTFDNNFDELDRIKKQIKKENPAAIGEIGLDHHHIKDEAARQKQEKVFRELLELAEKLGTPVVVHTRDAEKTAVDIIKEYDLEEVLLHCFNGKPELAEEAVSNDMLIGVTTQVLYSNRVQKIVETIGLDNMVLETDSPFLYRGSRNEPVNVIESAQKISELKEVKPKEVICATTSNAAEFFGQQIG